MRTFVAVELDQDCRDGLLRAIEALRPIGGGVRWVKESALHLTLKFIGELPEAELAAAVEALQPVAQAAQPFSMNVSGLSGFPRRGKPNVIFADVQEATGALNSLQKAVDGALGESLGIERERRRFVAHITLGRVKDRRQCSDVATLAGALKEDDFGTVAVSSFVLMKSDLTPQGAVYTPLHHFPLGG